ncbi:hypothetical protein JTB14_012858 [Gonioctena quinquepunctata]|nr:hypothetical protein JTB14_012858 [Gonioctena quinquepunctata]
MVCQLQFIMESKVAVFDMSASIDVNDFDLVEVNVNDETSEMTQVAQQTSNDVQVTYAAKNGEVLENDLQVLAVNDVI